MMLHRHFEAEKSENLTKLSDVSAIEKKAFVSEIFPPEEGKLGETPKRRGRPKKDSD